MYLLGGWGGASAAAAAAAPLAAGPRAAPPAHTIGDAVELHRPHSGRWLPARVRAADESGYEVAFANPAVRGAPQQTARVALADAPRLLRPAAGGADAAASRAAPY